MERVGRLLSKLKLPAGAVRPDDLARAAWSPAVGPKVAARAQAVWFTGGCLVVEVEDAVWRQQLTVLKGQILRKMEELLGQPLVGEIEFRLRSRRRAPQRADAPHPGQDDAGKAAGPAPRDIYRRRRRSA